MHPLLTDDPGRKMLLLGNEAIVRGAVEAGMAVAASYPGTPSSEIGNNLFQITQDRESGIYFEFSTNEKVAMEVTASASAAGLRTLTCMKHVGMNVASDVLMTLAYIGLRGGMVIVCADDPSMHSSQNEQDNRYYAKLSGLPLLEPTSPEEARDMTKAAFDLSEELGLPVILRTTTRTAHVRGPVLLGPMPSERRRKGRFEKTPMRWVPVPAVARMRHKALLEKQEKATALADKSLFNTVTGHGATGGIVASGVAACYVQDAIAELGCADSVRFLKLGFSYPVPEGLFISFLQGLQRVLVVEELEPFQEEALRVIAHKNSMDVEILGKASGHFSCLYEFDPAHVRKTIASVLGMDVKAPDMPDLSGIPQLPMRPPTLCKGCPHRETYNEVKEALTAIGLVDNTVYPTDIGCYTLGMLPPIGMADYLLCMGSSVGASSGFSIATDQKIVSFIGDSTFFHSGISSLCSAVHNQHDFCLVILDNSTTAMTGHQPNPGISLRPPGYEKPRIAIEDVVKGCGVTQLYKINPYKKSESVDTLRQALSQSGVTVVIAEAPCVLYYKRVGGKR